MLGYGNIFGGDILVCLGKYVPITEDDRLTLLALLCWDMGFFLPGLMQQEVASKVGTFGMSGSYVYTLWTCAH